MENAATRARILIGCSIGGFFSIIGALVYSFSVLAPGIANEIGISPLEATRLIGPALLLTIFAQPITGWVVDRWPRRNVALAALALLAAGLACVGFAPPSRTGVSLALGFAVVLSSLANPTIYNAYLSQTFEKGRGLAMGVAMGCIGLGVAAIPPAAAWLSEMAGWRRTYWALAAIVLMALVINAFLFPKASTPATAASPGGTASEAIRAAVRTRIFWIIAVLFLIIPIAANAVPVYLPFILSQRGAAPEIAAASMVAIGLTMIVSRPLFGFLIDRWPAWIILVLMMVGPALGSAALLMSSALIAAYVAAIGFGIGIGGEFVALGFIVARTFGVKNFGVIYGSLSTAVAAGVASGPIIVGGLSTETDSALALYAVLVLCALSFVLIFALHREERRHRAT